jgi:SpoVK/Ycf46/Vps4 family AAA+-type ATPase
MAKKDDDSKENEEKKEFEFSNETEREIALHIRSRYPLIHVVSDEEERVCSFIREWCKDGGREYFTWDAINGITKGEPSASDANKDQGTQEPEAAIHKIISIAENSGVTPKKEGESSSSSKIFVMKDFFRFLEAEACTVTLERSIRNAAQLMAQTGISVIFLGAMAPIPRTLDKIIPVITYPLPDEKLIKYEIFDKMLTSVMNKEANKKKIGPNIDKMTDEDREQVIKSMKGLTVDELRLAGSKSLVKDRGFNINTLISEKEQIVRKNGLLEFIDTSKMKIEDIGGLDQLLAWIKQRKHAYSDSAMEYGLRPPKGFVLLGIQGCGKSHVAKTTAAIYGVPCLRMDMGRLFGGIVGESEANVRNALRLAEAVSPCVLWIDEIEKGLSGTRSSGVTDGGTTARVLSSLLTWTQEKTSPVMIIATANDLDTVPPEVVRKGRFDEIFFVDLPNAMERKDIFEIHIRKRMRDPKKFDLSILAEKSDGFSGAEIEESINSAMFAGFSDGERELKTEDIIEAMASTKPLSETMEDKIEDYRERWGSGQARLATTPINKTVAKDKKTVKKKGKAQSNADEDNDGHGYDPEI